MNGHMHTRRPHGQPYQRGIREGASAAYTLVAYSRPEITLHCRVARVRFWGQILRWQPSGSSHMVGGLAALRARRFRLRESSRFTKTPDVSSPHTGFSLVETALNCAWKPSPISSVPQARWNQTWSSTVQSNNLAAGDRSHRRPPLERRLRAFQHTRQRGVVPRNGRLLGSPKKNAALVTESRGRKLVGAVRAAHPIPWRKQLRVPGFPRR